METDSQNFGQEEVKSLHVGLLLLGNDFSAIGEALLPQQKVSRGCNPFLQQTEIQRCPSPYASINCR